MRDDERMRRTFGVEGLSCNHCTVSVTRALKNIEGIEDVSVDIKTGRVEVISDARVSDQDIENAIVNCGYQVVH